MKKLLPYILIFVIIANVFAPFSVLVKKNEGVKVEQNKAFAADAGTAELKLNSITGVKVNLSVTISWLDLDTSTHSVYIGYEDSETQAVGKIFIMDSSKNLLKTSGQTSSGSVVITLPKENHKYSIWVMALLKNGDTGYTRSIPIDIQTQSFNSKTTTQIDQSSGEEDYVPNGGKLPGCSLTPGFIDTLVGAEGTFMGCLVQAFYYIVFIPTSFVFGLAGMFFDWAFAYSIMDTSYRSTFVTEGWGIMRDVCNLFFIFVLIYAAFGMILSIHSIKAKEIIVDVVIIGLIINFSLFAGQIMIDASNILTRVFYNSDVVQISVAGGSGQVTRGGVDLNQNSQMGELAISAALVNKVDPQKIIIEMSSVQINDDGQRSNSDGISMGTWFLVILMASAVNIVGLYVFFSVAILFIARVLGLWFALIFSPFAFFSYTVPQMQSVDQVGWKKWWPSTLGLCFMAPIFMFFLYLILMFLEKGFAGINAGVSGTNFVLSVVVPFIFIMMLLLMAKKFAQKYAGEMGAMVTKAGAVLGGVALGGAALGGAFLGRKIIGATVARASRSDSAVHIANQKIAFDKKLEEWNKSNPRTRGAKPTFDDHLRSSVRNINGKQYGVNAEGKAFEFKNNAFTQLGGALNKAKQRVSMVDHARHVYDAAKEKAGVKGVPDSMLAGSEIKKIELELKKSIKSDAENAVRRGENLKGERDPNKQSEDQFKAANRSALVATAKNNPANIQMKNGIPTGELTDEAKKKVENDLNVEFNKYLKAEVAKMLDKEYHHIQTEAAGVINGKQVTQFERTGSKANTGTWDMRNISDSKTDKRASIATKLGVGAVASIALAVRSGLKSAGNIDHGKGQGEFLKDLKETVSTAIKTAKIKVEIPHSSGGGGHDDHGGGHDDHGGGGGHH